MAEGCAQDLAHKTTPAKACDPALVGPDEMVSIASGKRTVEYDWLRDSLRSSSGRDREEPRNNSAMHGARLAEMSQEIASPPASALCAWQCCEYPPQAGCHSRERRLSASQTTFLSGKTLADFARWLLKSIFRVLPSGSSPSAIYLLELTVIAIPCGLLIWWFIRRLQVQRLGLSRDNVPHPSAPSAQAWEEWLEQGQKLGREGRWREAIHHVYWAAISCLESRRLWPADQNSHSA